MNFNQVIANWYEVKEIAPNIFWIREPNLVSFFLFRFNNEALLIDSGLGLSSAAAAELFSELNIKDYNVVCTHAHCDHIGLNAEARTCAISKSEWNKYVKQNEIKQLESFLKLLQDVGSSPSVLGRDKIVGTKEWAPTHYIENGQEFSFGPWNFKIRQAAGHTCGSLMFHETNTNFLFSGDIIYNGKMYIHLKDSNFDQFRNSINELCELKKQIPELVIWPSHNSIPLPAEFAEKVKLTIQAHDRGEVVVAGIWPKDLIFEEGIVYKLDDVQFVERSK